MAGSPITAVAQWVIAKTIAGSDSPDDANWLEILQTHADRQEYLYSAFADPRMLTSWCDVAGLSSGFTPQRTVFDPITKRWIAVGSTSTAIDIEIMTSHLQVTTWSSAPTPTVNSLISIATDGAGTIVAGGQPSASVSDKIITSTDGGISWTVRNMATTDNHRVGGLAWFNSLFVAVLQYGSNIQTSPTGTSWTSRTSPGSSGGFTFHRNANDGTTLVFMAADGTLIYTTNGTTFSLGSTLPSSSGWNGLAYSVTHGWRAMAGNLVDESADGLTWTGAGSSTLPSAASSEGVVDLLAVGDLFVAVCGRSMWVSSDGCQTWHWCVGFYGAGSSYLAPAVGEGRVFAITDIGNSSHCLSGRATAMP